MPRFARLLLALSLLLVPAVAAAQEQPMWEGHEKTSQERAEDTKFVADVLAAGTREEAAAEFVTAGWEAIETGDLDAAVFRFNRAWLLQPGLSDIHWGFAVASHLRAAQLEEVERHFATAEAGKAGDADFQATHGRVLFDREMYRESILYFRKALEIDPDNATAHAGMWHASEALGDAETAEKHRKIYEQ